jgi:hypothetical protein
MPPVAGPRRRPGRAQEETRLIGGLQPPSPKLPVLLPSSRGLDFRVGSPSFSQWVSCPRPTDSPHSFAIAPKHNKFPYRYPQRRRWWLEEKTQNFPLIIGGGQGGELMCSKLSCVGMLPFFLYFVLSELSTAVSRHF